MLTLLYSFVKIKNDQIWLVHYYVYYVFTFYMTFAVYYIILYLLNNLAVLRLIFVIACFLFFLVLIVKNFILICKECRHVAHRHDARFVVSDRDIVLSSKNFLNISEPKRMKKTIIHLAWFFLTLIFIIVYVQYAFHLLFLFRVIVMCHYSFTIYTYPWLSHDDI